MILFKYNVEPQNFVFSSDDAATLKVQNNSNNAVKVMASLDKKEYFPIAGVNDATMEIAQTADKKGLFTFNVTSFDFIKIEKTNAEDQVVIVGV